jgi:paraquat-inducible protein B
VSRKANPTAIGIFVLGAIALLVIGLAVFGSGKFFTKQTRVVAFFHGNIQGLNVGSAVTLRGVEVGTVTGIQLHYNVDTARLLIPVYMELDPSRLQLSEPLSAAEQATHQGLKAAIAKGLHARLASQSLVTGQLLVELNFDPNEPRTMTGADPSTIEIPTAQSDIEKLKGALSRLPLDQIAAAALKLMQDGDRLVTSPDVAKMLNSLVQASDNLDQLITAVHGDLPKLISDLRETSGAGHDTLVSAQDAMKELRTTLTTARQQLLATDMPGTTKAAIATLQQAQKTLAAANSLIATNSPQRYDIDQALRNLSAASRSLRVFADDLERRPNAVIVGK